MPMSSPLKKTIIGYNATLANANIQSPHKDYHWL
jgi:hypothetical protein